MEAAALSARKVTVVGAAPCRRLPESVTVMFAVSDCSRTLPERVKLKLTEDDDFGAS